MTNAPSERQAAIEASAGAVDAPIQPKRRIGRSAVLGVVQLLIVLTVIYFFALPWLGLSVTRVARSPRTLSGWEVDSYEARKAPPAIPVERPRNVILFVADGFGFGHLSAARAVLHGVGQPAVWDRFPATGWHPPHPARGFLIDSAASATALATGVPTNYGWLGIDAEGRPLESLLERGAALGYRTGIVTDSYVWDATPAAFSAHLADRDDAATLLEQLAKTDLEILVGELEDLGEGDVPEWGPSIEILESRFRVFGPDEESTAEFLRGMQGDAPVAAIFVEDQVTDLSSTPTLPQLVGVALERLSSDERPFVLLLESEEPDSASHKADFERMIRGAQVIEATLGIVLDFAERNSDTLVVFTSDHETGGLTLDIAGNNNATLLWRWSTTGHTGSVVPVMASGPGASAFVGAHPTWQLGERLLGMLHE